MSKVKIIIDTNVLISGLLFKGKPGRIVDSILDKKINTVFCEETYFELISRIQKVCMKMKVNEERKIQLLLICDVIKQMSQIYNLEEYKENIKCRDEKDIKFILLALQNKISLLVTGDKDLLELEDKMNLNILTVDQFCSKYLL